MRKATPAICLLALLLPAVTAQGQEAGGAAFASVIVTPRTSDAW